MPLTRRPRDLHKSEELLIIDLCDAKSKRLLTEDVAKRIERSNEYKRYKSNSGLTEEAWLWVMRITQERDHAYCNNVANVHEVVLKRACAVAARFVTLGSKLRRELP